MRLLSHYIRRHHIGLLALFVALGGTSYAAVGLAKNSVGPNQIRQGAVGSSEVKNRSLLARDFKKGQLPRGKTGAAGATGPAGQTGQQGTTGASALTLELPAARIRRTTDTQVIPNATSTMSVSVVQFPDPTAEEYDIGGMFDQATDNTVLTIPRTGTYVVTGAVRWTANAAGVRNLFLHGGPQASVLASSSVRADDAAFAGGESTRQSVATTERFQAGETLFLSVSQNSGGDLALDASQNQIHLSAAFIGS